MHVCNIIPKIDQKAGRLEMLILKEASLAVWSTEVNSLSSRLMTSRQKMEATTKSKSAHDRW